MADCFEGNDDAATLELIDYGELSWKYWFHIPQTDMGSVTCAHEKGPFRSL